MRVYYLTRSYPPSKRGSTLMRKAQVEQLQKHGWDVSVITVNYDSTQIIEEADTTKFLSRPMSDSRCCFNALEYMMIIYIIG